MGVTVPGDYCFHCREGIAEERPTHVGMAFDSCASAGCRNFHDNRALYDDFLVEHGRVEVQTMTVAAPLRSAYVEWDAAGRRARGETDVPAGLFANPTLTAAWAASAHAASGVGCSTGRHGMRPAAGLERMSPSEARLAMQPDARSLILDCGSCHDPHSVGVRRAAVDARLACRADGHSKAYQNSPHSRLWQSEMVGDCKPGSGVSCASCHLPREARRVSGDQRIVVQHNQNSNLRPNEKMIGEVCMRCHSLAFAIDSLTDQDLVRRNFAGPPGRHVPSIDMALSSRLAGRPVSKADKRRQDEHAYISHCFAATAAAVVASLTACGEAPTDVKLHISPHLMADALHAVKVSDRTVYTRTVVNRLQTGEGVIKASEHWQDDKALPLPAQMLRMGAEIAAVKTDGIQLLAAVEVAHSQAERTQDRCRDRWP